MAIDGITFVSTSVKDRFCDKVCIVAKNNEGQVVGTVNSETALNKLYAEAISPNYYDYSRYTSAQKHTLPHMYINSLQVDNNLRNKGIGRQLVARVVQESVNRGYEGRVIVGAGNCLEKSPLPFYKKLGFVTSNKGLNANLDFAAKYKTPFDNSIHAFMTLSKKMVSQLLKSIR